MNTRLFMLDASEETTHAADVLQTKFASKKCQPVSFAKDQKNCFDGIESVQEMASTAWLGHADRSMIGDYDADSFAAKFDKEFRAKFKGKSDKEVVRVIYIIGCEAAFQADGKASMAQKVADELYKKGYTNVCVRAVANKPNAGFAGMRVEVVTKVGMGVGVEVGDVNAYQLTADQEKRLKELNANLESAEKKLANLQQARYEKLDDKYKVKVDNGEKKLKDYRSREQMHEDGAIIAKRDAADNEIQKIKMKAMQDQSVLVTSNIRLELNKPAHQFLPLAVKDKKVADPKEAALQKINDRVLQLRAEGKKSKDATILEELYQEIQNDKAGNWRDITKHYLNKHFSGITRVNSTTKEMLNEIIKSEPASEKTATQPSPKASLRQCVSEAVGIRADKPTDMLDAINAIDDFIQVLKKEEANKPWKKLSQLFPLKDYKIQKLEELKENLKTYYKEHGSSAEKLANWVDVVKAAQTDKRLIKSRFSHRTENLLVNIIEGHPRKGILSPKDKSNEWKVEDRNKGKNTKRFV